MDKPAPDSGPNADRKRLRNIIFVMAADWLKEASVLLGVFSVLDFALAAHASAWVPGLGVTCALIFFVGAVQCKRSANEPGRPD